MAVVGFWHPLAYVWVIFDVIFRSALLRQVLTALGECAPQRELLGD